MPQADGLPNARSAGFSIDRNFVEEAERVQKHRRRQIALFIALFFAFLVAAICSTVIYDNSGYGIGRIFGEFIVAAILASAIGFFARGATYTPAVVVAVAALQVGILNAPKLIESIDVRQGMTALREVRDPTKIDQALKKDPSNAFLQLTAGAFKLAQETNLAVTRLFEEIEPPALANVNFASFASATRTDLEAYLRDVKIAEANLAAATPAYAALLKKERSGVENLSRSLNIGDDLRRGFLDGVDRRLTSTSAFNSKMIAARADLYRALETFIAFLIQQSGNYTGGANGQFLFADQSALDRFNVALNAVKVAATKLNQVDAERQQLEQAQQERWKSAISGSVK
jgi:hypothetical protein